VLEEPPTAGERAPEAVGAHQRRAQGGVVVEEVDGPLGLARQSQRPARAAPDDPRRLAAQRQRPQQRLGPEMLMDVNGLAHGVNRFTAEPK